MPDDVLLWGLTIVIALLVVNASYWLGRSHQIQICTDVHVEIMRELSIEVDEMEQTIIRLEEALHRPETRA